MHEKKLIDFLPTIEDVANTAAEELASVLLLVMNSGTQAPGRKFARSNMHQELGGYGYDNNLDALIAEAWNYLESLGLLIQVPGDSIWYFVSRKGRAIDSADKLEKYLAGRTLPRGLLHPLLRDAVPPAFSRGEYETAVFQAFKTLEVRVREVGKFPDSLLGTQLMRKAFDADAGLLTDMSEEKAEREALAHLFAGAIGRFKNPSSHRHVAITSAVEASEMVLMASHLLRVVDGRAGPP